MNRLITPVFVLALVIGLSLPLPVMAWQTSQTAKAVCEDKKAAVDWTFSNNEASRSIKLTLRNDLGLPNESRVIAAGQAASGTLNSGKSAINAGELAFDLKWADGEKGFETRIAKYEAKTCETGGTGGATTPTAPAPTPTLPNTGPFDTFGPYAAFLLAATASWLVTRRELVKSARQEV